MIPTGLEGYVGICCPVNETTHFGSIERFRKRQESTHREEVNADSTRNTFIIAQPLLQGRPHERDILDHCEDDNPHAVRIFATLKPVVEE